LTELIEALRDLALGFCPVHRIFLLGIDLPALSRSAAISVLYVFGAFVRKKKEL